MNKREEEKLKKQQEKLQKELERTEAMSVYEKEYSDCTYICVIRKSFRRRRGRHFTMRSWSVQWRQESGS